MTPAGPGGGRSRCRPAGQLAEEKAAAQGQAAGRQRPGALRAPAPGGPAAARGGGGLREPDRREFFLKRFGEQARALRASELANSSPALLQLGAPRRVLGALQCQRADGEGEDPGRGPTSTSLFLRFLCGRFRGPAAPARASRLRCGPWASWRPGVGAQASVFDGGTWGPRGPGADLQPFLGASVLRRGRAGLPGIPRPACSSPAALLCPWTARGGAGRPGRRVGTCGRCCPRSEAAEPRPGRLAPPLGLCHEQRAGGWRRLSAARVPGLRRAPPFPAAGLRELESQRRRRRVPEPCLRLRRALSGPGGRSLPLEKGAFLEAGARPSRARGPRGEDAPSPRLARRPSPAPGSAGAAGCSGARGGAFLLPEFLPAGSAFSGDTTAFRLGRGGPNLVWGPFFY